MNLELWKIVVLSVIQGATEFLPISSSGHLVVAAAWLSSDSTRGIDISDVNIVLHVGTLGSILVFYFHRIFRLLGEDRRVIPKLAVATLPAVLIGLPIKLLLPDAVESLVLENALLAGCLLPVTGLILLFARPAETQSSYQEMSLWKAALMGVAQAFAILPGISRSGSTIAAGMRLGLTPSSAATFSFLMAIPVIGGAGLIEVVSMLKDADEGLEQTPISYLLVGMAVSFGVGYLSLSWLVHWLERGRFRLFAWWCIPFGIAVILWQLWVM